jgi:hypothetical protein
MSHGALYGGLAAVVIVVVVVVGLGFANVIPGFHLGSSGTPATSTPTKYAVEFTETGLSVGASWTVVLSGASASSTNGTVRFQEPAGTYSYTIDTVTGYSVTPASGSVTVSGPGSSTAVAFTLLSGATKYSVTFSETGLTLPATWTVAFLGADQSGFGPDLLFSAPNGTHTYSVFPLAGYRADPSSGSVVVAGANSTVDIVFTAVPPTAYSLTFDESGLPQDTTWSVTVNGTVLSGSTGSLGLIETNGSYPYTVGSIAGYTPGSTGGTAIVDGTATLVGITFTSSAPPATNATYALDFEQVGLPSNATWVVYFGSNPFLGAGTQAEGANQTVDVPNGTYSWYAYTGYANLSVPGGSTYDATPGEGTLVVAGATQIVPIDFVANGTPPSGPTYSVNFTEAGLPAGSEWWVFAFSTNYSALSNGSATTGQTVELAMPNGTWYYNASTNASGYADLEYDFVTVSGGPQAAVVVFTPITTLVFNITNGIGYSPALINISQNGSEYDGEDGGFGGNASFVVPDGTYQWSASALVYRLTPSNGTIAADGTTVQIASRATAETTYAVTIDANGLGIDPMWEPSLWAWNGPGMTYGFTDQIAGSSSDTFQVPNGTYVWGATDPTGTYAADPASGVLTVGGSAVTVETNYTLVPLTAMHIEFEESSFAGGIYDPQIPAGASWSVTFDGVTQSSTGAFIIFVAPNGTYNYTVRGPSMYSPLPAGGTVTVVGIPAAGGDLVVVDVYFGASGLEPALQDQPHPPVSVSTPWARWE